jgi:Rieske Fe-S protein
MKNVERRTFLKGGLALGFGLAQGSPVSSRPKPGDLLVKTGDSGLKPLTTDDLPIGGPPIFAWPMDPADRTVRNGSRFNQIVVVRLEPSQLSSETVSRAVDGVVAYSGICTHDGCEVDDWLKEQQLLHCGCHFSKFDPKDGANVIDGPASRRLPALPLKIDNGKLVVAEPFTARVG